MDHDRARLVVLLAADDALLEGRSEGEQRTALPHGRLALGCVDNRNSRRSRPRRHERQLAAQALGKALELRGTAREQDVGVQLGAYARRAPVDCLAQRLMNAGQCEAHETWLE